MFLMALALLAASLFLYGYLYDNGYLRTLRQVPITLTLRKLKVRGDSMKGGETNPNIFASEFNQLFIFVTATLDFGVMKWLDDKVPLLVEQEHGHAKMHNEATRKMHASRFVPLDKVFDVLTLRSGRAIGSCMCLGFETISSIFFYTITASPFMPDYACDIMLFHFYEEVEHGVVTVNSFRPRTRFATRMLCLPVLLILIVAFVLAPIVTLVAAKPGVLLSVHTYIDLGVYLAVMLPGIVVGQAFLIAHYLPPCYTNAVGESVATRDLFLAHFERLLKARKTIQFDEVKQETYIVNM
jgi:hypothetical protein